ncbi:MAG: hypothetical protein R2827_03465 [Bdellovibrionales bacterium]
MARTTRKTTSAKNGFQRNFPWKTNVEISLFKGYSNGAKPKGHKKKSLCFRLKMTT